MADQNHSQNSHQGRNYRVANASNATPTDRTAVRRVPFLPHRPTWPHGPAFPQTPTLPNSLTLLNRPILINRPTLPYRLTLPNRIPAIPNAGADGRLTINPFLWTLPTPFFLYGTMQSWEVLTKCLFGDYNNFDNAEDRVVRHLTLHGYERRAVKNEIYPAAIKGKPEDKIHGFLCCPRTPQEVSRLKQSANGSFKLDSVEVVTDRGIKIPAFAWVWCDDLEDLEDHDWSFEEFQTQYDMDALLEYEL